MTGFFSRFLRRLVLAATAGLLLLGVGAQAGFWGEGRARCAARRQEWKSERERRGWERLSSGGGAALEGEGPSGGDEVTLESPG